VLAGASERHAHAKAAAVERERKRHDVGRSLFGLHRRQSPAGAKVRIVEQLVGTRDRCIGQARCFQLRRELVRAVPPQDFAEAREELRARMHALLVGRERGIIGEVGRVEDAAERLELLVVDRADEELLVIREREHVVDAPRRVSRGKRTRHLAGHRELLHVRRDEEHAVLEERALHFLSAAGALALEESGHDADRPEHAAHDVVDRRACA